MKYIVVLIGLLSGTISSASGVKVTSFKFVDHSGHSPTAEICGELVVVTGKPELIKLISDAASKSPATYYTFAGKDGKFCHLIATYTGKADADLAE